jgi:flagellin-specific chaperone FliS
VYNFSKQGKKEWVQKIIQIVTVLMNDLDVEVPGEMRHGLKNAKKINI